MPSRETRTIPSEKGAFAFKGDPGEEELCLVVAPDRVQEFEDIAESQDKGAGTRAIDLNPDQKQTWDQKTKAMPAPGKSRDLVLEQDSHPQPGDTPGNYVTDEGSESGFTRPITIYMTLKHEP
ncbi:MAG: hypothetical protein NTW86_14365 [Candidatus Sumerlaeota bacterium]|nr:hypothetical protein [Candidatus Sumerlaeota bacterium]